jgi:hypothetical protein
MQPSRRQTEKRSADNTAIASHISIDIWQCGAVGEKHHAVDYEQVRAVLRAAELSEFDCSFDMTQNVSLQ